MRDAARDARPEGRAYATGGRAYATGGRAYATGGRAYVAIAAAVGGLIAPLVIVAPLTGASKPFSVIEATIPEMRKAMEQRKVTSREIVTQYLARIGMYEDKLHAAIIVNPHALQEADERDRERRARKVRGPLHGIPVALKDNILTTTLPTTGGALAFDGFVPPYDATLVTNLRAAGAIIIAKTGMTELANWVATGMPGNYNAIAGFGMNPYDPRRDPRGASGDGRPVLSPGGSSSGIGTSANLWAANVGTETSGSILTPANATGLAGVKPTVGRISRYGVIPITADQDTAGPMAKSVTDVAVLLGALEGARPDPNDPATLTCTPPPGRDYTKFLRADGLKGVRIGIPRSYFYDRFPASTTSSGTTSPGTTSSATTSPGAPPSTPPSSGLPGLPALPPSPAAGVGAGRGGLGTNQTTLMADVIGALKQRGAVIVDPADIPSIVDPDPENNFLSWGTCSGAAQGRGRDENCSVVLKYGMKRDFNKWLASLGPTSPVKTLTELIAWNTAHKDAGAIKYGQTLLEVSDEMDVERDRAKYEHDRAKDIRVSATHGIDEVMIGQQLDALLFAGSGGAAIAAKAGYPSVIVPFGFVSSNAGSFPPGFDPKPQPFGVMFTGMKCSEPKLLQIAYAFEQATKRRAAPASAP